MENNDPTKNTPPPAGNDGTPLSFDEILKDRAYQSEFDKRVSKALETAKTKWETDAKMAQDTAVAEATAQLNTELIKAQVGTELVKAKVRDLDVVMPLIDLTKITRTDKGLEGLSEQVTALQTGKAYLFDMGTEPVKPTGKTGLEHGGSDSSAEDAKIKRIMGL